MIRCARCEFTNGASVGSAREREFLRVMDTVSSHSDSAYKDFYCSTKCYAEHRFLKFVCGRLKIKWREIQYFDIRTCTSSNRDLERALPQYVEQFYGKIASNVEELSKTPAGFINPVIKSWADA
jgi:hypothetical protein